MKFRYVIEEITKNGASNATVRDLDQAEVVIGRGSTSDILLDSRYVSLLHAKFLLDGDALTVMDLGSLSGVLVNGKPVLRSRLKAGMSVRLGDVTFKVTDENGVWGIRERRELKEKPDVDALAARQLRSLQIEHRFPNYFFLSTALAAIILCVFFVIPVTANRWHSWSSGPISNHHRMIAGNCNACHGSPFELVRDEKCSTCHTLSDHSAAFTPASLAHHKDLNVPCVSCHMEHNGDDALIARSPALCASCHADIAKVFPEAKSTSVPNFAAHPEFAIAVQGANPAEPAMRVRLDDAAHVIDNTKIKLNHAKHLVPLNGPKGTVLLGCRDCHEPSDDLKTIKPIKFIKHCQSCHTLEFDTRLPGRQSPHGDAEAVYKFLYAEYAKLALSTDASDIPAQEALNLRARPGEELPSVAAQPKPDQQFVRTFIEHESRAAEAQLFTKTACFLCHQVSQKPLALDEATRTQASLFAVVKPNIPQRWFPHAKFNHGSHEEVKCEECHHGVRASTRTQDVLLPGIKDCRGCHTVSGGHDTVRSDCVLCHGFHDQQTLVPAKKRSIQEILAR